jgi:hypothetical protein
VPLHHARTVSIHTTSACSDFRSLGSPGVTLDVLRGSFRFIHPRRCAMKCSKLTIAFATASLLTSGLLLAQTMPQSTSPPPSSSPPSSSSDQSASTSSQAPDGSSPSSQGTTSGDIRSQLKTCIAQART